MTNETDQVARTLAAAYIVKAAEEMEAAAALIKEGAYNAEKSGVSTKVVRAQLDRVEAWTSAEMKLRNKAQDLTGRYPHWSRRRPAAPADTALFEVSES
jgi:hypothetical protein